MVRTDIQLLDVVALLADVPDENLVRGQVGTVVERLADDVFEVEFSDDEGRTYAMLPLSAGQVVRLHYRSEDSSTRTSVDALETHEASQAHRAILEGYVDLVRSARQQVGSFDDALDVVQSATVTALESREWRELPVGRHHSYLFAMVKRVARALSRERKRDAGIKALAKQLAESRAADAGSGTLHEVEQRDLIDGAVATLTERDREMLTLRYNQELSYAEIAKRLGLSVHAAMVHTMRARERLQAALREVDVDEPG